MSLPTRQDFDIAGGTDQPIKFTLRDKNGLVDLTNDTVILAVHDDDNGVAILPKSNAPDHHADALNGETIFTLLAAELPTGMVGVTTRWWYTLRRTRAGTPGKFVHQVGEIRIAPTF